MANITPEAFGILFVVVMFSALVIAACIDLSVERWQRRKAIALRLRGIRWQ